MGKYSTLFCQFTFLHLYIAGRTQCFAHLCAQLWYCRFRSDWFVFQIGLIFVFNLIVGTGALTLPSAFAKSGWLLGLVLIIVLAFISYVTVTFVIEAMACANAISYWTRLQVMKRDGVSKRNNFALPSVSMQILCNVRNHFTAIDKRAGIEHWRRSWCHESQWLRSGYMPIGRWSRFNNRAHATIFATITLLYVG